MQASQRNRSGAGRKRALLIVSQSQRSAVRNAGSQSFILTPSSQRSEAASLKTRFNLPVEGLNSGPSDGLGLRGYEGACF